MGTLSSHTNWVKSVQFSPDAKLIGSGSDDKTVKIWDTNKQTVLYTYKEHNGVVNAVRFHPDCTSIASGCYDKKIRVLLCLNLAV
jgi:WD40 repeat protein